VLERFSNRSTKASTQNVKFNSHLRLAWLAVCIAHASCQAQGFVNLNFEFANVPFVPNGQDGGFVSSLDGLPGWTVYYGGSPDTRLFHNSITLGAAEVGIFGPAWDPSDILQGNYSVFMTPSLPTGAVSAGIGETGTIPSTARSLTFFSSATAIFQVTFGGQVIPLAKLGSGPNYIIQGADISQFAGQSGELRFTGGGFLDNIQFSSITIPEPSAVSLATLAGLALLNELLMTNRRCLSPLDLGGRLGRAVHAPPLLSAAVAYLRS